MVSIEGKQTGKWSLIAYGESKLSVMLPKSEILA